MNKSKAHSKRIIDSRHYDQLVCDLRNGKDCIIADIIFCEAEKLCEVEHAVTQEIPGLNIEKLFFENNPSQCKYNATLRRRANLNEEIRNIDALSARYEIPSGSNTIPCVVAKLESNCETGGKNGVL
ncbi:MAG: hypothetical protein M0Z71_01290 [Nitrospiraceae bacterium]|nr:hypothetical protein [Nitrospiraceae bacterium]